MGCLSQLVYQVPVPGLEQEYSG